MSWIRHGEAVGRSRLYLTLAAAFALTGTA